MSITYTVEKTENALIIHSAMETWKCTIIRNSIILCLCPFSKISHPPWLRASYTTVLILWNKIQKELKKLTKKLLKNLIMMELCFQCKKKILARLKWKTICINEFGYENGLVFPIYVSDKKFEDSRDLLLLINDDKSCYVYVKDFDRFMFHKTKNGFVEVVYNVLVAKMCW